MYIIKLSNKIFHLLGPFLLSVRLHLMSYYIQRCFICRPSDSTVPTDAVIQPRTVATGQLVHWQSDALTTRLDLIRAL
jgi:hypothetical protein